MSTRASKLKALKNELAACSKGLKRQIKKVSVLKKTAAPISARDLRAIAAAAGLGAKINTAMDMVLRVTNV